MIGVRRSFLLVVLVVSVMVMPSITAAQVTTPAPPDPPDGNRSAPTTAPEGETMVRQISPATWIKSYNYDADAGVWTITIKSEMPTTVTISEATMMDSEGSRRFNIRQFDIERGQTTIRFKAQPIDGASQVSITTPESVNLGRGVALQSGSTTGNPFHIFEGIEGLLVGVLVSVSMAFLSALVLLRRESDGVEVAD